VVIAVFSLFKTILNYIKSLVVLKLLLSLHHNNKQIGIMKLTSTEIYTLANEITEQQFTNLFNRFSKEEEKEFNTLVRLGDKKEVALWTVISNKYENKEVSELYNLAYNN